MTIFVCTYNSSATLEACLSGIRRAAPEAKVVLIDHMSNDGTVEIANRFGASVTSEDVSLGHARQMAFEITDTMFLAFVDSDVEIVEPRCFEKAVQDLEREGVGAVVGMAVSHRLAYGLPASLLVLRSADFGGKVIPDYIDARETYFMQERLDSLGLRTVYLADAIIHRSQYRRLKPEWEGANTRVACGADPNQLLFALKVIVMMSLNSRNLKNVLYVPVFYIKFLRGFANPWPWVRLERRKL